MKKSIRILLIFLLAIFFSITVFATDVNETIVTSEQEVVNPEPEVVTHEPEVVTPEPEVVTPEPEVVNPESKVVNPETEVVNPKPVTKPTSNTSKSTNNYLKSITLDEEGITPEFDKYTDMYYITVPLTVNYILVDAVPEDDNATVNVTGNRSLTEGENIITITVTAESGNWRVYKITVTKTDDVILANANLKDLTIEGYNIEFAPDKYKYTVEIGEETRNLNITFFTENEKATATIEGNSNFSSGDNKITIRVIAEDGITQREYTIYAIKDFSKIKIEEVDTQTKLIILIVCIALFIICFIIFINKLLKK